jgi:3-isopropylmalate dehydrogenase
LEPKWVREGRRPRVLVIPGDGIGPEVTAAAMKVLDAAASRCGVDLEIRYGEAGDAAAKRYGDPLPGETLRLAREWADAVFKGPVGETAGSVVVPLRRILGAYANLRPARTLPGARPIAEMDVLIVRENLEDVYAGVEWEVPGAAFAVKIVTEAESRRVAKLAARLAAERRKHVTVVHKANVLRKADRLFRDAALDEIKRLGLGVRVDELYVDAATIVLARRPNELDVILTMNQYGDILSDLAAELAGGIGLAPSANIGDEKALFEPVHGAAWDIAGRGIANPTASILSAALMLRWLGFSGAAEAVEAAVEATLAAGEKTPDLGGTLGTAEYAERVASRVKC